MTETTDSAASGWVNRLTAAAAALGAVIAVGQAGTTWINGHWQTKLAEIKDRSALAESYIKLIIDKDTELSDQAMLLEALSSLEGHPLQGWARQRWERIDNALAKYSETHAAREAATLLKTEDDRKEAELRGEIQALTALRELNREDVVASQGYQRDIVALSTELALVRGRIGVNLARINNQTEIISYIREGASLPAVDVGDTITALSQRITPDLLMSVFDEDARTNVEANVGLLSAAMKEFQISDSRLAAAIIATLAVERRRFDPYEEPQNSSNTNVLPFDRYDKRWGNRQAGDGSLFRERGYLPIKGRANYANMSARLGLGSRLVDSPTDVKSPEVAIRIAVAIFVDRLPEVLDALDRGDFHQLRRVVSGSAIYWAQLETAYNTLLPRL